MRSESSIFKKALYVLNGITIFLPLAQIASMLIIGVLLMTAAISPDFIKDAVSGADPLKLMAVLEAFLLPGKIISEFHFVIEFLYCLQLALMMGIFIFGFKRLGEFGKYYLGAISSFLLCGVSLAVQLFMLGYLLQGF